MVDLIKQKKFLKKWYDKTADKYDSWGDNEKLVSENCKKEMEGIKKILDVKKGDYCLDVATGTGNYLILMAEKGAICYGIDLSPNILEVTKNKVNKLGLKNVKELIVGDSDKLPYSDNFFDWVTCIGMFEYYPIEHVEKILIEFQRVLKKNGKILIDFPDINNSESLYFKNKSESVNTDVFLYDFNLIEKLIKKLQLNIIKKQIVGFEIQILLHR